MCEWGNQALVSEFDKPFGVDECLREMVVALNGAGFPTVASCCGHGHRPGIIALRDGRELVIARDFTEARAIDRMFLTDIHGNQRNWLVEKKGGQ